MTSKNRNPQRKEKMKLTNLLRRITGLAWRFCIHAFPQQYLTEPMARLNQALAKAQIIRCGATRCCLEIAS